MINVTIVKEVRGRVPRQGIQACARAVSQVMKESRQREASVVFVSEQKIQQLNATYRHKNKVTDVLSFGEDSRSASLGDIFLCYRQVARQAREHDHSFTTECMILTIHGLCHLYGYDHETDRDAAVMEPLELRIYQKIKNTR